MNSRLATARSRPSPTPSFARQSPTGSLRREASRPLSRGFNRRGTLTAGQLGCPANEFTACDCAKSAFADSAIRQAVPYRQPPEGGFAPSEPRFQPPGHSNRRAIRDTLRMNSRLATARSRPSPTPSFARQSPTGSLRREASRPLSRGFNRRGTLTAGQLGCPANEFTACDCAKSAFADSAIRQAVPYRQPPEGGFAPSEPRFQPPGHSNRRAIRDTLRMNSRLATARSRPSPTPPVARQSPTGSLRREASRSLSRGFNRRGTLTAGQFGTPCE
mgnify:CR=1 FL=1